MSFSIQTGGLRQTEHEIHALHSLTARALDEVIDRAHDHDAMRALVDLPCDVDEICAEDIFCIWEARVAEQTDKRFVAIGTVENHCRIKSDDLAGNIGVNRGGNAAIHRNEMGRELNNDLVAGQVRKFLFDLGQMSMFRNAVGPHALVALGEKIIDFGLSTCAGYTAHARH